MARESDQSNQIAHIWIACDISIPTPIRQYTSTLFYPESKV